jgi:hypothetical protein
MGMRPYSNARDHQAKGRLFFIFLVGPLAATNDAGPHHPGLV